MPRDTGASGGQGSPTLRFERPTKAAAGPLEPVTRRTKLGHRGRGPDATPLRETVSDEDHTNFFSDFEGRNCSSTRYGG